VDNLKPVNVAGATLVVQFCLLTIIVLGIACHRETESPRPELNRLKERGYRLAACLALFSILLIALTDDFYTVWSPITGDLQLPTLGRGGVFLFIFGMDIVACMILIAWTGGTRSSPYTAVLFLIPALAMFLREPPIKFFIYSTVVGIYYLVTCRPELAGRVHMGWEKDGTVYAHRVVNIGCLILATVTGYITRPQPL
jgi:hypothetical protein